MSFLLHHTSYCLQNDCLTGSPFFNVFANPCLFDLQSFLLIEANILGVIAILCVFWSSNFADIDLWGARDLGHRPIRDLWNGHKALLFNLYQSCQPLVLWHCANWSNVSRIWRLIKVGVPYAVFHARVLFLKHETTTYPKTSEQAHAFWCLVCILMFIFLFMCSSSFVLYGNIVVTFKGVRGH